MNGLSIAPTLAVVAVLLFFPSTLAVGQVAPRSCGGLAGDSRWVGESYRDTQVYGLSDPEEWIGSYGGLVTAGDSLFLYDQGRARIVHLSGNLEERHGFGRQGEGPGEFNARPLPWLDDASEGHVAFDGRQLVVYDRNDLTSFDAEGEYRWSALLGDFGFNLGRKGVVFVSPVDEEEVIYGVDALGAGPRRLQLWRMRRPDRNRGELLWEQTVPTRSRDDREWQGEYPPEAGALLLGAPPRLRRRFGWWRAVSVGRRSGDVASGFGCPSAVERAGVWRAPLGPLCTEHRWPRRANETPGARASLAVEGTHRGSGRSRVGAGLDAIPRGVSGLRRLAGLRRIPAPESSRLPHRIRPAGRVLHGAAGVRDGRAVPSKIPGSALMNKNDTGKGGKGGVNALNTVVNVAVLLFLGYAALGPRGPLRMALHDYTSARQARMAAQGLLEQLASEGRGAAERPTIVEFTDFQCPYCRDMHEVLMQGVAESEFDLVIMHFPLEPIHPLAKPAAKASLCAEAQGSADELDRRYLRGQPNDAS